MERVKLLSTDQSSSEVRMTATGQNHTGTRTRAAKGLFSHFMLLAGVMLIALLTSGKAYAGSFTHDIKLASSVTHITISQSADKSATLTAATGYALPATLTEVKMGADATLTVENDDYTYDASTGVITIGEEYTVSGDIVITATANTTLSTLTYTLAGEDPVTIDVTKTEVSGLDYTTALTVTLGGTVESGLSITTPVAANIEKQSDGTQKAIATIEVTANDEDATATTYTVTFLFKKDELASVTAPTPDAFTTRMADAQAAVDALNAKNLTAAITTASGATNDPLAVTWTYDQPKNGDYKPAGGETNTFTWTVTLPGTLNNTDEIALTGEVSITNVAASTDTKLATLTYQIGDDIFPIINGAEANAETESYSVTLAAAIAKDAEITLAATANDGIAAISYDKNPASLAGNTVTITLTITSESAAERTVSVVFTRTPSDVATLFSLKYQIGTTAIDMPKFAPDGTSYEVALPYTTADGTVITLLAVATDAANATITGETTVTLSKGTGSTTLTVTAEDETTQVVKVTFTVAKEKILSITAPTAPVLDEEMDDAAVLAKVNTIKNVAITTESGAPTELPISWELKTGTEFNAKHGAKNEYTWTIAPEQYAKYDLADDVKTSGDITVVNFIEALTGDNLGKVEINGDDPYTEIGGNPEKTTKAESVTVNTPLDNISFNNVEVSKDVTVEAGAAVTAIGFNDTKITGKVSLNENVDQLVLNNASVGEVALAKQKTTTLVLKPGSTIGQISNEGELTLTNSEILSTSVSPLAMLMNTTRSAVATKVANNGTFTDKTATILTVTGAANVDITRLPTNQSTTGKNAELSVATAVPTDASITYQWQKQNGSGWDKVSNNGTAATLSIEKVSNGTTSYRCEVKSVSQDNSATTILYTPAASVTFKTASDPSTPSDPTPSTKTYTVTLKKVTGATFSKGETTEVEEGDNYSFSIKLDKDYDQSKPVVKVGTTTYEPDAKGVYTIKNISKDITIEVSGIVKNAATGVEETAQDAVRVWGEGSTLYIHTPEAAEIYVISGAGALQRQLKAVPGDQNLQLPAGFYIVRVGTYTAKVIIR
ncbi:hypothetical protein [Parabacteroides sp.]